MSAQVLDCKVVAQAIKDECKAAADEIEAGDEVEVDFDSGMIYDRTKGTEYKGQAFPPFMQEIIKAEGLVNYINAKN